MFMEMGGITKAFCGKLQQANKQKTCIASKQHGHISSYMYFRIQFCFVLPARATEKAPEHLVCLLRGAKPGGGGAKASEYPICLLKCARPGVRGRTPLYQAREVKPDGRARRAANATSKLYSTRTLTSKSTNSIIQTLPNARLQAAKPKCKSLGNPRSNQRYQTQRHIDAQSTHPVAQSAAHSDAQCSICTLMLNLKSPDSQASRSGAESAQSDTQAAHFDARSRRSAAQSAHSGAQSRHSDTRFRHAPGQSAHCDAQCAHSDAHPAHSARIASETYNSNSFRFGDDLADQIYVTNKRLIRH